MAHIPAAWRSGPGRAARGDVARAGLTSHSWLGPTPVRRRCAVYRSGYLSDEVASDIAGLLMILWLPAARVMPRSRCRSASMQFTARRADTALCPLVTSCGHGDVSDHAHHGVTTSSERATPTGTHNHSAAFDCNDCGACHLACAPAVPPVQRASCASTARTVRLGLPCSAGAVRSRAAQTPTSSRGRLTAVEVLDRRSSTGVPVFACRGICAAPLARQLRGFGRPTRAALELAHMRHEQRGPK